MTVAGPVLRRRTQRRSTIFAARCYAQVQPMPSYDVCLSVRLSVLLSVTFVHCVKTSNHILKILTVGYPHHSSFQYQTV